MRFLITGGAGFIGSHLATRCSRAATRSTSSTTCRRAPSTTSGTSRPPGFDYTIDSAATTAVVAELVDECDVVYHLAAAVGVKLIVESPVRTIETNVHGTEVVLAQASKKKKQVLSPRPARSTARAADLPFREDGDLVLGPTVKGRWCYACSKAIDEFLALAYWKERSCRRSSSGSSTPSGPRQTGRYGMVIPPFVRQALAGQPITVYGDGTQRRCFCHVGDVVRGARRPDGRARTPYGEVFNIGSHEEVYDPRPRRAGRGS